MSNPPSYITKEERDLIADITGIALIFILGAVCGFVACWILFVGVR